MPENKTDKKEAPKEQPLWKYLLRMQETPSEEEARKAREAKEAREREIVRKALGQAVEGAKILKKTVDESKAKTK